jgi:transposase-like protein
MSLNINADWKLDAIKLAETGAMSWRSIARELDVAKSTCSDFLREYYKEREKVDDDTDAVKRVDEMYEQASVVSDKEAVSYASVFKIIADITKQEGTHLFIPDTQCKPNISLDYLKWLGQYIIRKKPDVIIHAGDHADMESLSEYDKGKKSAEGKRVQEDINSAIEGMEALLEPLYNLQQAELEEFGEIKYKPRLILTLGNHENRINRYVDATPALHGFLSISDLKYEEFGWEVIPFLTPINVGGVHYVHYLQNVMNGKPLGGNAATMLKTIGKSFSVGHKQTLDVATRFLQVDGTQQWGLQCGSYYEHEEGYKGVQGNKHWRGVVLKHGVKNGSYNPCFVSIEWLREQYGKD